MSEEVDSQCVEDADVGDSGKEKLYISVSFFTCALLVYLFFLTLVSGAQDILAATNIQTSIVLLADIAPYIFVVCVVPYFAKRIPYIVRFVFVFIAMTSAFLILGLTYNVHWKLFGVTLASFAMGVVDMSVIALTSYFRLSVLFAYSTGTGVGYLIGSLYYTAFTTWFCVSPNVTFLILAPMSILYLVCYYLIQKEIVKASAYSGREEVSYTKTSTEEVSYTKIHSSEDDNIELESRTGEDEQLLDKSKKFTGPESLTWNEKLQAVKKLVITVAIPAFIAFVCEYIFFQSVLTTVAFVNAPFRPRDHYQYYSVALMLGEVLGRSHRSLLDLINPKWLYTPTLKGLWALAMIEVVHLVFFLLEAWYRFIPTVEIAIFLCLSAGICVGLLFCNTLEYTRISFEEREHEFVFGLLLFPVNSGILFASLIGLFVEPGLRAHCIAHSKDSSYCFTRITDIKKIVAGCKAQ